MVIYSVIDPQLLSVPHIDLIWMVYIIGLVLAIVRFSRINLNIEFGIYAFKEARDNQ